MAKLPASVGVITLRQLEPVTVTLPIGTRPARVYFTTSTYQTAWNAFHYTGPLNSRWDHHLATATGAARKQHWGIYYAAGAKTCLAEVFQTTRRIARVYHAPWLVFFEIQQPLTLLDLSGDFSTHKGGSMAIHSGHRVRGWARDLYAAYADLQGIYTVWSMNGGEPAVALNERARRAAAWPVHPLFHRALADDAMLDPLKHAAASLGYALR